MGPVTCERCGAPLPDDARACPRCGVRTMQDAGRERKFVTILFADLTGSTELAARLDPERFSEVLRAFYEAADGQVSSLRGRTEKFIGDAVMAVFGVPRAQEDDALRAVRAALSIREKVAGLAEDLGLDGPLRLRIGVDSGPVAAGSGPAEEPMVSGATVNLAARLQEAADPGEILAGETTWQLVRHEVDFGEPRAVAAKGFQEPLTARPVGALSRRSFRRTIPLVGRRRELTLLLDAFRRARETSRAHLITLLGEPGVGKSRLSDELVATIPRDARVLAGRSGGFEEDVSLAPVAQMLRAELGLGAEAEPDIVRERLLEVTEGCCDPSETERTAARLSLALGLGGPAHAGHPYRIAEVRAGLESLLTGLAREGPVVLVFEDLHLAPPDLLDLVEAVIRGVPRIPLVVLCVGRERLLEVRPGWGGGIPDALTLRLEPLSDVEAVQLALAAGGSLDEPTARRVARLAGGNPFFVIETTGMLLEWAPGEAPSEPWIPPTAQAVAASRLDHLPSEARDLVRKASVFPGAAFHERELSLVAEPDPGVLGRLEEAELLVRDPRERGRWRFRHEILREVAYESLAKRDRVGLHVTVADGLETEGVEDLPARAVAQHLELAARASMDLGAADRTLTERAVGALARVGDKARERIESRTAVDLYRRALALAGPEGGWAEREARILAGLGEAQYWLAEFETAEATLTRALALGGGDLQTRTLAARFLGDIVLNIRGDPVQAAALFDQALEAARELGDLWATARTLLVAGWAPYWRRDLAGARALFERALAEARANPDGDPWAEARALVSMAGVVSPAGDEGEALSLTRRALELGRVMGDPFTVAVAQGRVGNSLRRMGRLEEALPCLEEAVAAFRELGARWELAEALGDRGGVHWLASRLEEAEADLRGALTLCAELGERALVAWTTGELAFVLLARGRKEEAREVLRERTAQVRSSLPGSESEMLLAEALLARAEGDEERALGLARKAVAVERTGGSPNYLARAIWWVGRVFGSETAGGEEAVEEARHTLNRAHWVYALEEPELVLG